MEKTQTPEEIRKNIMKKCKKLSTKDAEQKAREYGDTLPDPEDAASSYEPTYRDGSLKNECW